MNPRTRQFTGIGLVVIGALLFYLQWRGGASQAVVLAIIGGTFVLGYFARKQYNLLVPGGVLLGLALGSVIEQQAPRLSNPSALGIGIGFIGIYVIDRLYRKESTWWPLIPGGILVISGIATAMEKAAWLFSKGWPLLLVIAGVLVLTGIVGRGRGEDPETPAE